MTQQNKKNQLSIMPTIELMHLRLVWSIKKLLIHFFQHGLKMIWANFGKNQTNCIEGGRKCRFSKTFKMAEFD